MGRVYPELTINVATGAHPDDERSMSKPILLVILAGLLSGCVTSPDQYGQTAVRRVAVMPRQPAAVQSSKMQGRAAAPMMLGTAY
jgi:hypothetical protein